MSEPLDPREVFEENPWDEAGFWDETSPIELLSEQVEAIRRKAMAQVIAAHGAPKTTVV